MDDYDIYHHLFECAVLVDSFKELRSVLCNGCVLCSIGRICWQSALDKLLTKGTRQLESRWIRSRNFVATSNAVPPDVL
jgi:hypothetical protein